jgi:hypothetical protein
MTDEQMEAQRARGVSDGLASYTLDDARCNETSAVYDGAVTGAGFNKALSGFKSGKLSDRHLNQVKSAYGSLLGKGDLDLENTIQEQFKALRDGIMQALGIKPEQPGKHSPSQLPAPDEADQANADATTPEEDTTEETETDDTTENTPPADPQPAVEPTPEHPVLQAAITAGVTTAAQFAELQRAAEDGKAYLVDARAKAKKLAVIALGNTTPAQRLEVDAAHKLIDQVSLEQLKSLNSQYERIAEKLGLRSADGAPMGRNSAAGELPKFAQDAQQAAVETKAQIMPVSDLIDLRREQAREAARKR